MHHWAVAFVWLLIAAAFVVLAPQVWALAEVVTRKASWPWFFGVWFGFPIGAILWFSVGRKRYPRRNALGG